MSNLLKLLDDMELKEALLDDSLMAEEILQLLDLIYIETTNVLKNHQHESVLTVLVSLIKFDGKLKDIIHLRTNDINDQENDIFEYLELQAQVNTFRNKLIEEIIHYLCDRYEYSRQLAKVDTEIATKIFKTNKSINDFYINQLLAHFEQEQYGPSDSYRKKTCKETISSLEEVSNIALKNLLVLAQKE